jgi:hypothetical protein
MAMHEGTLQVKAHPKLLVPVTTGALVEDFLSLLNRRLRDDHAEDPSQDQPGDKPSYVGEERHTSSCSCLHAEGNHAIQEL